MMPPSLLHTQAVAQGPEHQGEQADRGGVGRGFGDGGDGEGAAVPVWSAVGRFVVGADAKSAFAGQLRAG